MDGGRLCIRLAWRGGRLAEVSGETRRPAVAALLRGKTPAQAVALVPLLFSLCGRAQQAVSRAACQAAEGGVESPTAGTLHGLLAEAAQEHLWRLLVDWPRLLALPALDGDFAAWHRRLASWTRGGMAVDGTSRADGAAALALAAELEDFLRTRVLGVASDAFLAGEPAGIESLAGPLLARLRSAPPATGSVPPRCLPRCPAAAWAADSALAERGFAAAPQWAGGPAETGALARQQARPAVAGALAAGDFLRARLLARLCDLAEVPARLRAVAEGGAAGQLAAGAAAWLDAASGAPGHGLACTETARGLLIHWLRLAEGRIADYAVIAPSEWNFHPAGPWRRELAAAVAAATTPAEAEVRARQLVLALDPCVPLDLALAVTDPDPENDHA